MSSVEDPCVSELPLPTLPPLPPALRPPDEIVPVAAPQAPPPQPAVEAPEAHSVAGADPPAPSSDDPAAVVAALVMTNSGLPATSSSVVPAASVDEGEQPASDEQPPAPTGSPIDDANMAGPPAEPRVLFGKIEVPEWVSAENAVEVTKTLSATAVMSLVGLLVVFMLVALVVLT